MSRPNVLLLVADQFRGDCLGVAGHPDVKTPFLDTIAEKGIRFSRAYTATPSCVPARASLMTGMDQRHHGRVGYQDGVRWDYPNTLAECFTRAGYQTHCAGKMHVHPVRARLGFEDVELHDGYLHYYRTPQTPYCENQLVADDYLYWLQGQNHKDVIDTGCECNGCVARPWMYDESLHPTNWVAERASDFLRRRDRDHPFFLMASFVRPHPPFDAPACYFDMYRGKPLRAPVVGDWAAPVGPRIQDSELGVPDAQLLTEAQVGYYAAITHLDHQIGRILQQLHSDGSNRNTVIAFVSDHGELLGDHNLFRKSLPYEGSAHVPFILSGAGLPAGRVIEQLVGLQDVMPTLLAACDLPIPDTVNGHNALSLLDGCGWRDRLHGEHLYGGGSAQYIVTERDKYIWFSKDGREQYFDLARDPSELSDRIESADCAARISELRRALIEALNGREEGYVQNHRLIAGRPCRPTLRAHFGN